VFTSIICPVDFSPHAERALGYALDLAALAGSHHTILTAVDPFLDAASNAAGRGEALMRQTQDEIQALLVRLGDARRMPAEAPSIAVVTGDPAEAILAQIAESNADN
jgi:nucleotide-binding universal stress UspA family protein